MKTLFTSEVASIGGRSGSVHDPDGLLNFTLGNPLESSNKERGPNPEMLFAAAYAACYHGALINAAKKSGQSVVNSRVQALVSLMEDNHGGYHLSVELRGELPGVDRLLTQEIMEKAHQTCPYSKALRGDAAVTLTALGT